MAVPGVQPVGGPHADDVLDLGQRHGHDGVVDVGVARGQVEGDGDGRGEVVLGEEGGGPLVELGVGEVGDGVPGRLRVLAVLEGLLRRRGRPARCHCVRVLFVVMFRSSRDGRPVS